VTGYQQSKSLILAGRPKKYRILHKIVRDRQKQRLRRQLHISFGFWSKTEPRQGCALNPVERLLTVLYDCAKALHVSKDATGLGHVCVDICRL